MASKIVLQKFNKKVVKAVQDLGGVIDTKRPATSGPGLNISTKAGLLAVKLHEPDRPSGIFSIFCCFYFPTKAVITLSTNQQRRLNAYSGKWNFHSDDEKYCFDDFISNLKEIL